VPDVDRGWHLLAKVSPYHQILSGLKSCDDRERKDRFAGATGPFTMVSFHNIDFATGKTTVRNV
jgi:hypothetical protein